VDLLHRDEDWTDAKNTRLILEYIEKLIGQTHSFDNLTEA